MTFTAVEDLVGRLPESAYRHRAWWGNSDGTAEAKAWLDAGWRVESVNQAAGEVVFTRADSPPRKVTRSTASYTGYIDAQVSASLAARAEAIGLDPGKLTRLVAELNDNYSRGNAYAAHALLRAVLDHIPPLLGCADFKAAANNYAWSRTDRAYGAAFWILSSRPTMLSTGRSRRRPTSWGSMTCHRRSGSTESSRSAPRQGKDDASGRPRSRRSQQPPRPAACRASTSANALLAAVEDIHLKRGDV